MKNLFTPLSNQDMLDKQNDGEPMQMSSNECSSNLHHLIRENPQKDKIDDTVRRRCSEDDIEIHEGMKTLTPDHLNITEN